MKDLRKLPPREVGRIVAKIELLAEVPFPQWLGEAGGIRPHVPHPSGRLPGRLRDVSARENRRDSAREAPERCLPQVRTFKHPPHDQRRCSVHLGASNYLRKPRMKAESKGSVGVTPTAFGVLAERNEHA